MAGQPEVLRKKVARGRLAEAQRVLEVMTRNLAQPPHAPGTAEVQAKARARLPVYRGQVTRYRRELEALG